MAREVFDAHMPGPHQQHVLREDVHADRDALLATPLGSISRAGFDNNVEVCVRYLAAWLDGMGCVPIHWLMEDAATAEIARAQLWQWLHFADRGGAPLHLADDGELDFALLDRALIGLPARLSAIPGLPGAGRVADAIALLDTLTHADTLLDFLTWPAYAALD
jgi:malate synthase